MKENIEYEIISKPQLLPPIHPPLAQTPSGKWVSRLNHRTSKEEINAVCTWSEESAKEYEEIKNRLKESDPKARAVSLRRTKANVDNLTKILKDLSNALSQTNCEEYVKAKKDAETKRAAASSHANKVFEGAPLEGVGSDTWKLLWEQARRYSEEEAYKGIAFPNTEENSKCLLCHQSLDDDAKKRFTSFEEFVKGGLEKEAADAEKKLAMLQEKLQDILTSEKMDLLLDSAGLEKEDERKIMQDLREELEKRKDNLIAADNTDDFLDIKGIESISLLESLSSTLEKQASGYEKDASEDNRAALQSKAMEYAGQKWIYEQKEKIIQEVDRLSAINKLVEAKRLTRTHELSNMKSSLAEVLITEEYIGRFNDEIEKLGAKYIGIELVKTRTEKGRALHKIILPNNRHGLPTSEILSEGEFRIISLAAFVADVEGSANKSTFIFDDPITSLDQEYEEATVNRLVELSKSRQVIVFTHRLSMLAMLEEMAGKNAVEVNVIGLQRETWGAGEPREAPLPAQKPKKAINSLINRVAEAKKTQNNTGQEAYELIAKGICSEIRITLERLVENDLLADVVHRFRREIHTKNKLNKLSKITPEDCKYIDDLMTEYSKYEHSQSNETPVAPPDPDKLDADLKALKDWRDEFEKRDG